jgi:hypothetical protein
MFHFPENLVPPSADSTNQHTVKVQKSIISVILVINSASFLELNSTQFPHFTFFADRRYAKRRLKVIYCAMNSTLLITDKHIKWHATTSPCSTEYDETSPYTPVLFQDPFQY